MLSFLFRLFDTSGFPPRWHCGTWSSGLGWLHVISDSAIFGAYMAIPCVLAYFAHRRRDVPFLPIFWLFVAFIAFCGLGHLIEASIFWHPWYRLSGLVKLGTAIVSWGTVFALMPVLPRALALPGLAASHQKLQVQAAELRRSYEDLEQFTRHVVDRESRVLELKREVNELLEELGRNPRYPAALAGQ